MFMNCRGAVASFKLSPNLRKALKVHIGCSYPSKVLSYILCITLKEKNYSKENEVTKMERLLGFVKEPLIEREIKIKDQQPKK